MIPVSTWFWGHHTFKVISALSPEEAAPELSAAAVSSFFSVPASAAAPDGESLFAESPPLLPHPVTAVTVIAAINKATKNLFILLTSLDL